MAQDKVTEAAAAPFKTDISGKEAFAINLESYIAQHGKDGLVITVDAPWGSGKTYFAEEWQKRLTPQKWPHIYIDAFASDYLDNAFDLIAGEIVGFVEKNSTTSQKIKKAAKGLAKITAKILVRLGPTVLLAATNPLLSGVIAVIANRIKDITVCAVEKKLNKRPSDKQLFKDFKTQLAAIAAELPKPLIIMVDEIDRCNPKFSVDLLEKLKHFFDVKNIVFILLVNKTQLHAAIRGSYGNDIDAETYLHKFCNLSLPLPLVADYGLPVEGYKKLFEFAAVSKPKLENLSLKLMAELSVLYNVAPREALKFYRHVNDLPMNYFGDSFSNNYQFFVLWFLLIKTIDDAALLRLKYNNRAEIDRQIEKLIGWLKAAPDNHSIGSHIPEMLLSMFAFVTAVDIDVLHGGRQERLAHNEFLHYLGDKRIYLSKREHFLEKMITPILNPGSFCKNQPG